MAETFTTDVPARLDRLPFGRFHGLVIGALGVTWILDGLEVTLVGALSPVLTGPHGLNMSATAVGLTGSVYILGAVLGALVFGQLTDAFGRRRLFTVTVGVYLVATILSGLAWSTPSFLAFRFLTGAGIGGEYGAINSAIDELIPARHRGRVALGVNGSFWVGAALGALSALVVLDPERVDPAIGWRAAFVVGGLLALIVIVVRRAIPESPRWLMTHGRPEEAEAIVAAVEARAGIGPPQAPLPSLRLVRRGRTRVVEIAQTLLRRHPRRTVLGLTLMATQAFCYNAIFFTYALVLTRFYGVRPENVGWFLLPFAAGNVLGPLLLGPLFDHWGRKPMIAATYALAGVLLTVTGWAFAQGWLDATSQTVAWMVVFFFASAGASAAYLTVGELFPLETRAVVISLFYAFGTLLGGVAGPAVFGALIQSGSRPRIFVGDALGGALMLLAALVELALGVAAERRPLEEIAAPLGLADESP